MKPNHPMIGEVTEGGQSTPDKKPPASPAKNATPQKNGVKGSSPKVNGKKKKSKDYWIMTMPLEQPSKGDKGLGLSLGWV